MEKPQNKKEIEFVVWRLQSKKPIVVNSDIIANIHLGDIVRAGHQDAKYYSDSQTDGYYFFEIIRKRLETDDEFNKRQQEYKKHKVEYKERQYQTYLKLKEEFEDGTNS